MIYDDIYIADYSDLGTSTRPGTLHRTDTHGLGGITSPELDGSTRDGGYDESRGTVQPGYSPLPFISSHYQY